MSLPEVVQQKVAKDLKPKDQFSIRKVHVKQDMERFGMRPMSPYQVKADKHNRQRAQLSCKPTHKIGEFSTQEAILSSNAYKELNRKFLQLKKDQAEEREKMLNTLRDKTEKAQKAKEEKERLQNQKQRLAVMAQKLAERLEFVRERNYSLRQNMEEYQSMMNAEYLRNLILSVRFQNELLHQDINPDNMTYEELLQLEQKIGNVSKGLTEQQIKKLQRFDYVDKGETHTCTICYYEVKAGENVTRFICKHLFHSECIQEWLSKEKLCPMCKQEIVGEAKSPSQ